MLAHNWLPSLCYLIHIDVPAGSRPRHHATPYAIIDARQHPPEEFERITPAAGTLADIETLTLGSVGEGRARIDRAHYGSF